MNCNINVQCAILIVEKVASKLYFILYKLPINRLTCKMDILTPLQKRKRNLLKLLLLIQQCKIIQIKQKLLTRKKRKWIRACISEREMRGEASTLVQEMRLRDLSWYYNYTRMTPEIFDELLCLVGPTIQKQETNFRQPILPAIRLLITLRYLASGDLMASLAMSYCIGKSTVSGIIQDTCEAIWEVLQDRVLFQPSQQDWMKIADGFFKQWNFPHCIAAIDGKHVMIQAPPHAGSTFYNYKGQHSIVLIAIVSASYKFLMVDIGAQGRHNDSGIFKGSNMGQRFGNKQMDLPPPRPLSNRRNIPIPYMIVGDAAFQLNENTLRPYPSNQLNRNTKIFNYRLSRARRVVENAFGIMASKWRIHRKPINASLKTTESIIKATICLHNFLLSTKQYNNITNDTCLNVIQENPAIRNVSYMGSNTHSRLAASIRNDFCEYFVQEGSVPWQEMYN